MKRWSGFTLLELLAVIAIIGILAAISLGSFAAIQRRNRDNQRKTDLNLIAQAVDEYYAETRTLPCDQVYKSNVATQNGFWIPVLTATYLPSQHSQKTLPIDPKNNDTYHYTFECVTDGSGSYKLTATLEGPDPDTSGQVYTIEH